ncbi:MAG: sigma-70 family RNA polymerase sigma factor [Bacilli bacterium]
MKYSDDYLLMLVHERSDEAEEEMYNYFEKTVKYKAYKYKYYGSKLGLDFNDLIQEGYIGLSQSVDDYSLTSTASFSTFASMCIEREIQNAVTKASRKKHLYLNEAVSINEETKSGVTFSEIIPANVSCPEVKVLSDIYEMEDYNYVLERLTKLERDVFILKYNGYSYIEIADVLKMSPKRIDNALQRIKRKVKYLFDL